MPKRIVYPKSDGSGVVLLIPTGVMPVEVAAVKDVPYGVPYLIIDTEDVPNDFTFFDAWESDFSVPHGHGIGPQRWFISQYEQEIAELEQGDSPDKTERINDLNQMIALQRSEMPE